MRMARNSWRLDGRRDFKEEEEFVREGFNSEAKLKLTMAVQFTMDHSVSCRGPNVSVCSILFSFRFPHKCRIYEFMNLRLPVQ